MPFTTSFVDPVVVVAWNKAVLPGEITRVVGDVSRRRAKHGSPLRLVMVIPTEMPTPDASARKEANAAMDRLLEASCDSVDVVIEGSGVVADMMRTIMRGLTRLLRHRGRVFFHATVNEGVQRAVTGLTVTPAQVLEAISRAASSAP